MEEWLSQMASMFKDRTNPIRIGVCLERLLVLHHGR